VRDRQTGNYEIIVTNETAARDAIISPNGRYIGFTSRSSTLVPDDTNETYDYFLYDRQTHTTERVSVSSGGEQARPYTLPAYFGGRHVVVSDDGTVAFWTWAENFAVDDSNGKPDVFVRYKAQSIPVANPGGPYVGWAASADSEAAIKFDSSLSFDPGGRPLVAQWSFGDDSIALTTTESIMAHSYYTPGTYLASLTVSNGLATSDLITTTVSVEPVVGSSAELAVQPSCGEPGTAIHVSGAAPGANRTLLDSGWDLTEGTPTLQPITITVPWEAQPLVVSTILPDFSFVAPFTVPAPIKSGSYPIGMVEGPTAEFTVPCPEPDNHAPRANAGGPYIGTAGVPLTFDGSGSFDVDGDTLTYAWNFGDEGEGDGVTPQHTYKAAGTYYIQLVASDGEFTSLTTSNYEDIAVVKIMSRALYLPQLSR
jgi:PKD repeat protein